MLSLIPELMTVSQFHHRRNTVDEERLRAWNFIKLIPGRMMALLGPDFKIKLSDEGEEVPKKEPYLILKVLREKAFDGTYVTFEFKASEHKLIHKECQSLYVVMTERFIHEKYGAGLTDVIMGGCGDLSNWNNCNPDWIDRFTDRQTYCRHCG